MDGPTNAPVLVPAQTVPVHVAESGDSRLDGQALAAADTASGQDAASAGGGHSGTEAVHPLTTTGLRLPGSLGHSNTPTESK